jgi:type II secretion system protein G
MINKLMKGFKKNNKGFTLVELMVVVVIIGILVAIAVPVYNASQARAKKNACEANIRILKSAIQQYYLDTETALTNLDGLVPNYLESIPKCPVDESAYVLSDDKKSIVAHTH